jgi:serine/threonine-protein kinase
VEGKAFETIDSRATVVASPVARRKEAPNIGELPPPSRPVRPPTASEIFLDGTTTHALQTEEAGRAMAFSRAITSFCAAGTVALPFMYSTRPLYWPMAFTVVALGSSAGFMWWRMRAGRGYSRAASRVFMCACTLGGLFIQYDLGVFSPAPLFIAVGISFFSQSHDRRYALGVPILCAIGYFVLTLLVLSGALPDLGLFSVSAGPPKARIIMMFLVPIAFLVALAQARLGRLATLSAIAEANAALRLVLQREAQLEEAQADLDHALKAGAGASGRYTGALMGKYRLGEVVGRGAMGEIYAATHEESGQRAAVKVLQANVSHDRDLVERFFREGRIAKRLSAPNIVKVLDVGDGVDGAPYIAMELLVGQDLSACLRQRGQLPLVEVLELVDEVARGLAAAHEAGVVHRDLKPQNIFRAEVGEGCRPVWKILDFGVSKLLDTSATMTNAMMIGTPGYMSPEQAEGRDADLRSDVFALGAVTYRALTGRPPFRGEVPQILFEIAYKSPVRPSDLVPELPSDVEHVLAIALAKRPDDRFPSAPAFAAALRDAGRSELDPDLRARGGALLASHPWAPPLGAAAA